MNSPLKQIALAFPMGVSHLERVAFGIHRYAQEQGDWLLISNPERHHLSLSDLKGWQGDGLVAFLTTVTGAIGIPAVYYNVPGATGTSRATPASVMCEGTDCLSRRNRNTPVIGRTWVARLIEVPTAMPEMPAHCSRAKISAP